MEEILKLLPLNLQNEISLYTKYNINEIRIRKNKNVILRCSNKEFILNYIILENDILNILLKCSSNSIYAIQNDINNGYITLNNGSRIGITGEVVLEKEKIVNIKNVSSLNIRIAKEVIGVAEEIRDYVIHNEKVNNILIVSPPGYR